ncbi:MAG TPA: methyltransferase domain-containing protein [Anaerolineae bacterium]|nr:methyltransferase domain-containing protein [Anaerolineae bacterium]HQI87075.1 methyltransferase domain-containing protein [Anaerolineae bacterium]
MIQNILRQQYRTAANLNARIDLHRRFSANPYPWHRWVFDHLALPADARILELGCGPADLWRENADRIPAGWDITLTDFSEGMVAAAQQHLAEIGRPFTFRQADAQDLSFEADTFDAVIANHMLYHVPDRPRAFAEIRRVLKPGGVIYAATNGERHMMELWKLEEPYIPNCYARVLEASKGFLLENGAAQLTAAGFTNVVWHNRSDALEITEVEPLIAYVQSNTLMNHAWPETELDALRAEVTTHIAANGAFHIGKVAGMFVARAA